MVRKEEVGRGLLGMISKEKRVFIFPFLQQIFIGPLLCVRCCLGSKQVEASTRFSSTMAMKAAAPWGFPVHVGSRTKPKQGKLIPNNGKQGRSKFREMGKSKDLFVTCMLSGS